MLWTLRSLLCEGAILGLSLLSTKQTSFYFLQASGLWYPVDFWRVTGPMVAPWAGRAAPVPEACLVQTPRELLSRQRSL